METTLLILLMLVALTAMLWRELAGTKREMRTLDQKLNAMLRQIGIDPSTTDFSEATIKEIGRLYRDGRREKAMDVAKKNLVNPDEFKKAWQECQKAAGEEQ